MVDRIDCLYSTKYGGTSSAYLKGSFQLGDENKITIFDNNGIIVVSQINEILYETILQGAIEMFEIDKTLVRLDVENFSNFSNEQQEIEKELMRRLSVTDSLTLVPKKGPRILNPTFTQNSMNTIASQSGESSEFDMNEH
ncbi:MAG: hypothetical protein EZS28_018023 [Streblomastix strix]|uniref:Uncharacterized protein n=1 Tax=Streblomastix strix TaxID=222440 RepID=A0A5J4VVI1_9EUKA|nr:MAG: hypothetical protein EZS28_018023 [Streblomastix strix]